MSNRFWGMCNCSNLRCVKYSNNNEASYDSKKTCWRLTLVDRLIFIDKVSQRLEKLLNLRLSVRAR